MNTFQTAAVVGLIDNLSGPLRQLAANAKAAVRQIDAMKVSDSRGVDKLANGIDRANRAAREHVALLTRMKSIMGDVARFGGMYAGYLNRQGVQYEKKFDDELNRMRAFTRVDAATSEQIRRSANAEGVKWKGGALGFAEAAGSALREGLSDVPAKMRATLLPKVAVIGQQFADLIKVSPDEGMAMALNFASMRGAFVDPSTKKRLMFSKYAEKFGEEQAMGRFKQEMGDYLRLAALAPGKERSIFDLMKFAGPSLSSLGFKNSDQAALLLMLAQGGIEGAQAGTYIRGMVQRSLTPSRIALDASRMGGLDLAKYAKFEPDRIEAKNVVSTIERRFGALHEVARSAIVGAVDKFKSSPNANIDDAAGIIADAILNVPAKSRFQKKGGPGQGIMSDRMKASAWIQQQLYGFSSGVDFMKMLTDMAGQEKEKGIDPEKGPLAGLFRKVFGMEAGTGGLVMALQDIGANVNRAQSETGDGAWGNKTAAQSWDEAFATRLDSFGQKLDQVVANAAAAYDNMFRSIEGPAKGLADALNNLMQGFNSAATGVHQFATIVNGVLAALGGLSLLKLGSRLLGGGLPGLAAPAATAGGVLGGAATIPLLAAGGMGWLTLDLLNATDRSRGTPEQNREKVRKLRDLIATNGGSPHESAYREALEAEMKGYEREMFGPFGAPPKMKRSQNVFEGRYAPFPSSAPEGWSPAAIGGFTPGAMQQTQDVSVRGEAEVVWNGKIEVGLTPATLNILQKASMGLSGDAKMGPSRPQGVDKAMPGTAAPTP